MYYSDWECKYWKICVIQGVLLGICDKYALVAKVES